MRATILQTLRRSSHEYNEGAGRKNTGDVNPGDHGAGFIYTPVHSLGGECMATDSKSISSNQWYFIIMLAWYIPTTILCFTVVLTILFLWFLIGGIFTMIITGIYWMQKKSKPVHYDFIVLFITTNWIYWPALFIIGFAFFPPF
jgi:hypothetical protein